MTSSRPNPFEFSSENYPTRDDYHKLTRREEAALYCDESFSSEYLGSSEEFDEEKDTYTVDAIIADRKNDRVGEREYQVAWEGCGNQLTWQLKSKLEEDCPDMVDEYKSRVENKKFRAPTQKRVNKRQREQHSYEKASIDSTDPELRERVKRELDAEIKGLLGFEDFTLAGYKEVANLVTSNQGRSRTTNEVTTFIDLCSSSSESVQEEEEEEELESMDATCIQEEPPVETNEEEEDVPTLDDLSELLSRCSEQAEEEYDSTAVRMVYLVPMESDHVPVSEPFYVRRSERQRRPPPKIRSPSHSDR